MPTTTKQYYAFISYKRDDQKWAEWLQEKLEHYKLPSNLNGRGDLPKEIRPVFRDKSELAAGVLADEIQKALDNSKYLIVICSPHSAKSEWVNKEVQAFIDSGRTDKIIPFIIEGTPNSGNDETECFPKAIRELPAEDELLGVNINEMGRDAAAVKVVAQMFGLRFDDLWQRHEREKKRKRHLITAGITAFAIAVICVAGWIWHQNVVLKQQRWQMLESQSKLVSEMVKMNAQDDSYLARLAALEVLPKDVSNPVDRPYTAEAERALREASQYNSAVFNIQDALEAIFTPDDEQILVMLLDSTLRLIAVNTGNVIKTLKRDYVSWGLCYSPCGKHIISHNQNNIFVLDAQNLAIELSFVVDTANIYSAKYSPDGNKIITISGNSIKIFDAETGSCVKTIEGKHYFKCATYSPDGKYIAAFEQKEKYRDWYNPDTCRIIIYDDSYKVKRTISRIDRDVAGQILFSPDSKNLLIISAITEVVDIATGDVLFKINTRIHTEDMCYSPDGKTIMSRASWSYSTSSENVYTTIKMWDSNNGELLKTLAGHKGCIGSAKYNKNGDKIVSVSNDGTIRLWDLNGDNISEILYKNDSRIFASSINTDLKQVALSGYDDVKVWDWGLSKETLISKFSKYDLTSFNIIISNDGKRLLFEFYDYETRKNKLDIFDLQTGEIIKTLPSDTYSSYGGVVLSPDGQKFVCSDKNNIELINLATDTIVWSIDGQGNSPVAYSPDGKLILVGKFGGELKTLDSNTGEDIAVFKNTGMTILSKPEFSLNGKLIALGSNDNSVKLYDAETGKSLKVLEGHTNGVMSVGFSPDNKYLVSGSKDKTIRVWDVASGVCVRILKGHDATVKKVIFTSDGRHIISVSDDYTSEDWTVRQWDFPPLQELIDQTRERFKNRPLTEEEREMYYLE